MPTESKAARVHRRTCYFLQVVGRDANLQVKEVLEGIAGDPHQGTGGLAALMGEKGGLGG